MMCFHALYFHIFLHELPRMDHTCSKSQLYPENFHYEMNKIILSCPLNFAMSKPPVLRKTMTSIIRQSSSSQYVLSSSVVCTNWQSMLNENLLRTTVSAKVSRCNCDMLFVNFFTCFPPVVGSFSKLVICL